MKRYVIIENEEFARRNLIRTVSRLRPDYQLAYEGESVEEAVEYFRSASNIDLVLMDIELVDGNCFDIFRQVDTDVPVIFTTAYRDFAMDAFSVHAVDYLLKPVSESSLLKALVKFEQWCPSPSAGPDNDAEAESDSRPAAPHERNRPRRRLLINVGDNYLWISMDDVTYFIRDEKYVCVSLKSGKRYITDFQNLADVDSQLDPDQFFQLSRNLIVSINAIRKVTKWFGGRLKVVVGDGTEEIDTVVSATRRPQFIEWLGGI